ncbi:hypothetical protein ACFQ14_14780 [Pseudahrensia aquimaris]|uniref:Uncharacterized protein n=1 Tax=Pseudahrensia aquimaris TaxID=744461 RepID=A0ABW3FHS4_9HYPH
MSEETEKSCWGVTLWTVAIVVALVLVTSLFQSGEQAAQLTQKLV